MVILLFCESAFHSVRVSAHFSSSFNNPSRSARRAITPLKLFVPLARASGLSGDPLFG